MPETNINAYKAELATAKLVADRANSRVAELESYIKAAEPTPKKKTTAKTVKSEEITTKSDDEKVESVEPDEVTPEVVEEAVAEIEPDKDEKVETKTTKKGKK